MKPMAVSLAKTEEPSKLKDSPLNTWAAEVFLLARISGFEDEQISEWIKAYAIERNYTSRQINTVFRRNGAPYKKRHHDPKLIRCRKCNELGILGLYYARDKAVVSRILTHYVRHHPINGRWGILQTTRKYKRCYPASKYLPEMLDYKNRYIEPPSQSKPIVEVICPRCNEVGILRRVNYSDRGLRIRIKHYHKSKSICYLSKEAGIKIDITN